MKNSKQKRGQITIFIIAGIIILFTVALATYIVKSQSNVRPPVQQLIVSDSIRPVQVYVTDCLNTISKDAILKIGQNGGYATLDDKNLNINPVPYRSDALVFEPQIIPYWYHLKDCKEKTIGCLESRMPPLCKKNSICILEDSKGDNSIQQELEKYVEKNINSCINNFEPFNDRFDITSKDAPKVEAIISNGMVGFKLDYDLDVKPKGTQTSENVPYFYAEQNVNLKDIYVVAKKIYEAESNNHFLETATMNLISIYSDVDRDRLPPTSRLEFDMGAPQMWTRSAVKKLLEEDVLIYLNFAKIAGTLNGDTVVALETSEYDIYAQGIYHSLSYKLFNDTYDITADVIYPYSDIYLNIGGNEIIKGEKLFVDQNFKFIMSMVGFSMNQYKFKYDISYPVIIQLSDPYAFNNEGYTFNYAMEANIRQNIPVTGNITMINLGGIEGVDLNSQLQVVDRVIHIESIDKYTKEPLSGVSVAYKCGNDYEIGITQKELQRAVLETKLPYCEFGGSIVYSKEGYMGGAIDYDNLEDSTDMQTKYFNFELWPIKEKNIEIRKRTPENIRKIMSTFTNVAYTYRTEAENLTSSDTVFLNIAKTKENSYEEDIPRVGFLMVTKSNRTIEQLSSKESQKQNIIRLYEKGQLDEETKNKLLFDLELLNSSSSQSAPIIVSEHSLGFVPGTYNIDATLIYNNPITIPEKKMRFCKGIDTGIGGVCIGEWSEVVLETQTLENFPLGGSKIEFTLTENDVYSDKKLIIYVLEMPVPSTWDDLEDFKSLEEYQSDKLFILNPRLE